MLSTYSVSSFSGLVSSKRRWHFDPTVRVLQGDAEVQADRLRVTDVEIAVRFRRKAGDGGGMLAGREVVGDDLADEVELGSGGIGHWEKDRSDRSFVTYGSARQLLEQRLVQPDARLEVLDREILVRRVHLGIRQARGLTRACRHRGCHGRSGRWECCRPRG